MLREVDRIEAGALGADSASGPVVLLVKSASGDEEVGAAGIDLKGVLLCHTVPHLSHLGVQPLSCLPCMLNLLLILWLKLVFAYMCG